MALTWSGFIEHNWSDEEKEEEEEEFTATMEARPLAAQIKDAAFVDLQTRLNAVLAEVEQGQAREAALLRRAEKSEEAEEALASQMAELEAEAFTRITQGNKLLAAAAASQVTTSQLSMQVGELESRLQAAVEEVAGWARRCQVLKEEAKEGRIREAAFQRRAEIAEKAEEALAWQMGELEAEAFTRLTENAKKALLEERCDEETEPITGSQVEELERQLAGAREGLEAVHAKLREAEEKTLGLEMRVAQLAQEKEKGVMVKRKQGGEALLSLSLEEVLAGFVKFKLWNPSSLGLTLC